MLGSSLSDAEVLAVCEEKDAAFREIARNKISAFPGVVELVRAIKGSGYRVAIGSSSPLENIEMVVTSLGIKEYFDAIVFGREVKESKPSPQIFLLAAERLGTEPERCVVIEDAVIGIEAAKSGGMKAVAVTNTHPKEKFTKADLITDSLEKITPDDLRNLVLGGKDSKAVKDNIIKHQIVLVSDRKMPERIAI